MNAPNPIAEKRSAERKAYEPSMDEILASIRRIIADDQAFSQKKPTPLPAPPRPAAEPRARIEPTIRPAATRPAPQVRAPFGGEKVAAPPLSSSFPVEARFHTFKTSVVPQPLPAEETDLGEPPMEDEAWSEQAEDYAAEEENDLETPIASPQTEAAVASSFSALAAVQAMPSDEQLDEIVREMIRPLLKAWLDDNLPVLVERLVRAEIERVARGGR